MYSHSVMYVIPRKCFNKASKKGFLLFRFHICERIVSFSTLTHTSTETRNPWRSKINDVVITFAYLFPTFPYQIYENYSAQSGTSNIEKCHKSNVAINLLLRLIRQ